jgi:hypothetical protein
MEYWTLLSANCSLCCQVPYVYWISSFCWWEKSRDKRENLVSHRYFVSAILIGLRRFHFTTSRTFRQIFIWNAFGAVIILCLSSAIWINCDGKSTSYALSSGNASASTPTRRISCQCSTIKETLDLESIPRSNRYQSLNQLIDWLIDGWFFVCIFSIYMVEKLHCVKTCVKNRKVFL